MGHGETRPEGLGCETVDGRIHYQCEHKCINRICPLRAGLWLCAKNDDGDSSIGLPWGSRLCQQGKGEPSKGPQHDYTQLHTTNHPGKEGAQTCPWKRAS